MGHIYSCNHTRNNYKIKLVVTTKSNLKDLSTAKCNFDLDLNRPKLCLSKFMRKVLLPLSMSYQDCPLCF